VKPTYHPLDGTEIKAAILKRIDQGMSQAIDTRAFRSYPLVRWKITIEVQPYEHAGADVVNGEIVPRTPESDPLQKQTFQLAGYDFVEVEDDGVRLSEDSKIIGHEVDPQSIREQTGLGRMGAKREEGQYVDTYIKAPEPPAPTQEGTQPLIIGEEKVPPSAGQVPNDAEIRAAEEHEETSWSAPAEDPDFREAIETGEPLRGRVTVVGTGKGRGRRSAG
jgi:hypothetical protein